jgi:hypothetical protein
VEEGRERVTVRERGRGRKTRVGEDIGIKFVRKLNM